MESGTAAIRFTDPSAPFPHLADSAVRLDSGRSGSDGARRRDCCELCRWIAGTSFGTDPDGFDTPGEHAAGEHAAGEYAAGLDPTGQHATAEHAAGLDSGPHPTGLGPLRFDAVGIRAVFDRLRWRFLGILLGWVRVRR